MFAIRISLLAFIVVSSWPVSPGAQAAKFRANYVGQFQYFWDFRGWHRPILSAYCRGDAIEVVGVSHPSIECTLLEASSAVAEDYPSGVQCINTCADFTACQDVFVETQNAFQGKIGEIFFQCDGDDVNEVDAFFEYFAAPTSNVLNYHIARLGVFCPDPVLDGHFLPSFHSNFFECSIDSDISNFRYEYYTCFGRDRLEFQGLAIEADLPRFQDECVQALTDIPVPAGSLPTAIFSPGKYTARFQANWGIFTTSPICLGRDTERRITVQATCKDGSIQFLNALDNGAESATCDKVNNSTIVCTLQFTDSTGRLDLEFRGAIYECTSDLKLPETSIEVLPESYSCGSSLPQEVEHRAQLGVFCGDVFSGGSFNYLDHWYECDRTSRASFDRNFNDGDRLTCSTVVTIPAASSESVTISAVRMQTDFRWVVAPPVNCFTFEHKTTATSPPTTAPITSFPTFARGIEPTISPVEFNIPSVTQKPSGVPSSIAVTSPNPSSLPSALPSISLIPSSPPTARSQMPSATPTTSPSDGPTASLIPSAPPTVSRMPTSQMPSNTPSASIMPSSTPSDIPSDGPTTSFMPSSPPTTSQMPSASQMPSNAPSNSVMPSSTPSDIPSDGPTASVMPSLPPTASQIPSASTMPSTSVMPSFYPSDLPSNAPSTSLIPSSAPTTSPLPSVSISPSSYYPSSGPSSRPSTSIDSGSDKGDSLAPSSGRLSGLNSFSGGGRRSSNKAIAIGASGLILSYRLFL